jgi:hypothetical protein
MAPGQAQPLIAQQADSLTGRAPLEQGLEDQAQRMRHGSVGIFAHATVVLAQHPGREGQGHVAALGLLLHARNQPAPSGGELDRAHDPLHAQQETPMGRRGIIDAIAVRHQTVIIGTQIEPGRPSRAVPGQARALLAQHNPDLAQGDLGQERLRAVAPLGALGRAAHVGLHDLDACIGPAEVVGMLTHGVVELVALAVGAPLVPGGLPHGKHGFAPEMMGVDNGSG